MDSTKGYTSLEDEVILSLAYLVVALFSWT